MPAGMSQEVLAIIDVIGNHVRTEILRRLARSPMTAVDLAADIDIAHSSVHRHLVHLEERGLVSADAEPGHRRGNKGLLWATVPEKVTAMDEAWIKYALGEATKQ